MMFLDMQCILCLQEKIITVQDACLLCVYPDENENLSRAILLKPCPFCPFVQ